MVCLNIQVDTVEEVPFVDRSRIEVDEHMEDSNVSLSPSLYSHLNLELCKERLN